MGGRLYKVSEAKIHSQDHKKPRSMGWLWVRSVWRRKWQPTPVLLPGESLGQRSLVGYTVHGVAASNTTERLTHTHTHTLCVLVQI